ncbi:MAG: hypothetical protein QOG22_1735, partial [Pseudonocardiales bacterium]|nr:hypothetical protein [Pseudonocardiales bacterium]
MTVTGAGGTSMVSARGLGKTYR